MTTAGLETCLQMKSANGPSFGHANPNSIKHNPRDGMKSRDSMTGKRTLHKLSGCSQRPYTPTLSRLGREEILEYKTSSRDSAQLSHDMQTISMEFSSASYSGTSQLEEVFVVGLENESSSNTHECSFDEKMNEIAKLSGVCGMVVVGSSIQKSTKDDLDHLLSIGKIKELALQLVQRKCFSVLIDQELTPIQFKNMEESLERETSRISSEYIPPIKILDRTALIIDAILLSSHTVEAKLQAELAQLLYRLPRITKTWSLVSELGHRTNRLVGIRGAASDTINLDRRWMKKRISEIKEKLDDIKYRRANQRIRRKSTGIPSVVLVGYTGSGKTSLFSTLTHNSCTTTTTSSSSTRTWEYKAQSVNFESESSIPLFDTVDSVTRRVRCSDGKNCCDETMSKRTSGRFENDDDNNLEDCTCKPDFFITDSMGLIDNIPTCVLESFSLVWDELLHADALILVSDSSSPTRKKQEMSVLRQLSRLGLADKPILSVLNLKGLSAVAEQRVLHAAQWKYHTVAVNCVSGIGVSFLYDQLHELLDSLSVEIQYVLPYSSPTQSLVSRLLDMGSLCQVSYLDVGVAITGRLPQFAEVILSSLSKYSLTDTIQPQFKLKCEL